MYHARNVFERTSGETPGEAKFPKLFLVFLIVMMCVSIASAITARTEPDALRDQLVWP